MRHIRYVLVSLVLLPCSIAAATAENVCVQAADGAIVCGPVASQNTSPSTIPVPTSSPSATPSPAPSTSASPAKTPFDLPATTFVPQGDAAPLPAGTRRPSLARPAREATRNVSPPKHAYRQQPPREFDRRPPPAGRIAREDVRRREAERYRGPPPGYDRGRPVRYSEADRRGDEINRERPMPRFDRNVAPPRQYEVRLRELEREVRTLRGEREAAMRSGPDRRDVARQIYRERPPPPRYADREMRERERYAAPQRPPRQVDRGRYSDEN